MHNILSKTLLINFLSKTILIGASLFILMLIGCQSNPVNLTPEPTSSVIWTTTKDFKRLQPILFTRDDLKWEGGEFSQETNEMPLGELGQQTADLPLKDIVAEDVAGVYWNLEPRVVLPKGGSRRGSILGASQLAWVYSSEEKAIEAIEFERYRFSLGLGQPMEVDPQLNNVITGCARAFDSDIKEHLNCSFMGQHGHYVTNINMPVDGTVVTLDDWHDLTNAIQNRMITQVEKDRENLNTE